MRVYKVLTIILIILFSFTIVCSAKSAEDFVKDAEKENKAELKELQKLLDEDSEFLASMMLSLNSDVDPKEMVKKLKSDNAYKKYMIQHDIFDYYNETGDFRGVISDQYYWIVPLSDEGIYISFSRNENDNSWQWSGTGNNLKYPIDDINSPKESVDFSMKGIVKRLKDEFKKKDIDNIYFLGDSAYWCDFVYLSVEGVEYLIPYSRRPDFTGLKNGQLYTAREAIKILQESLGVPTSGSAPDIFEGGGFGKETDSAATTEVAEQASFAWLYFAIPGAIILIGLAVTAAVIIKKRHKAK